MITNFKNKKLIEYLEDGLKVLIRFGHGWGDTQMFLPIFSRLKELYPNVHFDLYLESGQEEIFESYPTKDSNQHDLIFSLDFPMSEGSNLTKPEKCCIDEIGIEPITSVAQLPKKQSPLVGCHFHGTALPNSVNCPEDIAKLIWDEILESGKIPIETHFEHMFHNPANRKFNFITNNVRNCKANLTNLIGLIQHCFAFIGVASGPVITALAIIPDHTLYIQRSHKISSYTKLNIPTINVNNYERGFVKRWLTSLN